MHDLFDIQKYLSALEIIFAFIPRGLTSIMQPLVLTIKGNLKNIWDIIMK